MLRRATEEDALAVARVHVASWRETYAGILPQAHLDALDADERAERWREWMAAPLTTTLVAQDGAEVVGFASAGPAHDDAPTGCEAELYAIYLLRQVQGRGLGRALFDASRDATGGRALVVWALEQNPWRAFYEKLGGRVVATKRTEVGGAMHVEVAYGWPATD